MTARAICWAPIWHEDRQAQGMEHLVLREGAADSVLLAYDEDGWPFRLSYKLRWDNEWGLHDAELTVVDETGARQLTLRSDGRGHWRDGNDQVLPKLDGCFDIDIWPTPFTNTFPIRRADLAIGERRAFTMAYVIAPALTVQPATQAYTRLDERRYLFESIDSDFRAELPVDEDGIVLDYHGLFRRLA
ncbi:putative glycolipid-binding domain-containing protein [Dongia soli]|uniref:Glycolipid-binding domain-containing protein n=1 Tax=Dongia soli TaxID=600628 RepID=A0ABU5E899_9PROT|nr:putative glycolipid-binding domain-containing protein [Dongia soli]MDY0881964.1 putative glycolipid-binding domain-containing protein [Dongia soli]